MTILLEVPALYYFYGFALGLIMYFVLPYLVDPYHLRRNTISGPSFAALSNLWLASVAARGDRSESVHKLHQRYGKLVRIAPNHISIADPKAIEAMYGHGSGTLKSEFYDAFVSIRASLFTTRDRVAHARKRKVVSGVLSQQNVLQFEPLVRKHVRAFLLQWDLKYAKAEDEKDRRAWFNIPPQFNFLTFDITGDLTFGTSFGMIEAQRDVAPMLQLSSSSSSASVTYIPAIKVLNDRGNFSASVGVLPPWIRKWVLLLPWYRSGNAAVQSLAGMANAAVERRLREGVPEEEPDEEDEEEGRGKRVDLLEKLMDGKDEFGEPLGREELTAEALTLMIAATDTTSNSSSAITYYLAAHPDVQQKLQAELDDALGAPGSANTWSSVAKYSAIKSLPYLHACIQEGMRMHSALGAGLPRLIPKGIEIEVCGEKFTEGTVLSVPSYSIHHNQELWGDDSEEFKPERWLDKKNVGKEFVPFSFGPRACVGRNLASLMIVIIIASIFHRYDVKPEYEGQKPVIKEGLLRKPIQCVLGIKKRRSSTSLA